MFNSESRDAYLQFLYDIVGGNEGPCRDYRTLMAVLLDVEFIWSVANDDNRAQDGLSLRNSYFKYAPNRPNEPCSVLEMMVALAHRIETDITYDPLKGDSTGIWFMQMLINLGLNGYIDALWDADKHVNTLLIVDNLLDRRYEYSGNGGLFPLKYPMEDQRNVEIWGQMASFLYENSYQKTYQN